MAGTGDTTIPSKIIPPSVLGKSEFLSSHHMFYDSKWKTRVTANELLLRLLNRVSRIRNRVPNNMFEYTIVHLIFRAPQTVVRLRMYAKVYLAVHLLQR